MVSIVIPVYNGANYMREAIDSAIEQTWNNCEVIVVNDGSTDSGETERIALSYGDKIRYYSKKNGGVATAVNYGIEQMHGDYFAWLSHDDVFYKDKIEKQMNAILESGDPYAICHGNFDFLEMDSMKKTSVDWLSLYDKDQLEDSCFAPLFLAIHGSTVLFHKYHFDRVGKYRTDLRATQDSEFLFRVMRGQKSVFVDSSLIIGRLHPEQGQRTMKCHKTEYNQMFVDFCENLTDSEKIQMCGSVRNFYYHLWTILKSSEPADTILDYLKSKMEESELPHDDIGDVHNICDLVFPGMNVDSSGVFIFGAGYYGKCMLEKLRMYEIPVEAFIDNDKNKWGKSIDGIPCCSVDRIKDDCNNPVVIIAVLADANEIDNQLAQIGIKFVYRFKEINRRLFKLLPVNCGLRR